MTENNNDCSNSANDLTHEIATTNHWYNTDSNLCITLQNTFGLNKEHPLAECFDDLMAYLEIGKLGRLNLILLHNKIKNLYENLICSETDLKDETYIGLRDFLQIKLEALYTYIIKKILLGAVTKNTADIFESSTLLFDFHDIALYGPEDAIVWRDKTYKIVQEYLLTIPKE